MRRAWLALLVSSLFVLIACSGPSPDPALSSDPTSSQPTPSASRSYVGVSGAPIIPGATATSTTNVSTPPTEPAATPLPTPLPPTPTLAPVTSTPTPTVVPVTPAVATLSSGSAGQTRPVPILMYHYVRPDPGPTDPVGQDLSVTPQDFANEMQYLADHGYTTMTLSELSSVRAGKLNLPAKPVVLTFDDGYLDFYTTAWPILQQHKFKATIFVVSGFADQPRYMTWDMIRKLDQSGYIEVGAHTIHHVNLAALSTDGSWAEINGSKSTIEQQIGHTITSFCYPSGRYSASVVAQVKRAGFSIATTTNGGFAKAGDEQLLLPRVRIHGTVGLPNLKANLP